jgi:hypothetical protein
MHKTHIRRRMEGKAKRIPMPGRFVSEAIAPLAETSEASDTARMACLANSSGAAGASQLRGLSGRGVKMKKDAGSWVVEKGRGVKTPDVQVPYANLKNVAVLSR